MAESVFKGILKYSISTWVNLVVGFLSVIITTRLIAPDVYGQVAIFFSASSVLMYILTMGMDGALIRFYNEPPGGNTKSELFYKCIIISTIVCLLVGGLLVLFKGRILSEYIFGESSCLLFSFLILYTFVNIILRYFNISYRMTFRIKQYTIQNVLINCFSRVLLILAALITSNFLLMSSFLTIGMFVVMFVYVVVQREELIPYNTNLIKNYSLSLKGYREFFLFALYSAPTYVVFYLNDYLSKQIIISNNGMYALGIFSSSALFGTILTGLKGGFGTYWSAYVYKNYKIEKNKIIEMHDYVVLFAIFAASLLVGMRDIVYLIIGVNYHDSKIFFSLLLTMPLLTFILETTDKGIAIAKKNQITFVNHTIAVITNLVCCIFFTKQIGVIGAAFANMISAIVLYILNTVYGQKYYRSIFSITKSIIGIMVLLFILLSAIITTDIRIIIITIVILDVIACFIYKKQLLSMLSMIRTLF